MAENVEVIFWLIAGLLVLHFLLAREVFKIGRLHNQLCDIVEEMRDSHV